MDKARTSSQHLRKLQWRPESPLKEKFSLHFFFMWIPHPLSLWSRLSSELRGCNNIFWDSSNSIQLVFIDGMKSTMPHQWFSAWIICGTRCNDRLASVRPFAVHLPSIKSALEDFLNLNLTPKTRHEVNGAITYVSSFKCIIMSVIWF